MKLNKKIMLGTISTIATIAAPIATVVSCNDKKLTKGEHYFHNLEVEFRANKMHLGTHPNGGISSNFKLLPTQSRMGIPNDPIHKLLEEKNGKIQFRDASNIATPSTPNTGTNLIDLGNVKEIRLDITLADSFKEKFQKEYKEKHHKEFDKDWVEFWFNKNNEFTSPQFFESLTTPQNARLINQLINDEENKQSNKYSADGKEFIGFRLTFNLILPGWLNKVDYIGVGVSGEEDSNGAKGYGAQQVAQITYGQGLMKPLLDLDLRGMVNFFDVDALPRQTVGLKVQLDKQLEGDDFSDKAIKFDPSKLPSNLLIFSPYDLTPSDNFMQAHTSFFQSYKDAFQRAKERALKSGEIPEGETKGFDWAWTMYGLK